MKTKIFYRIILAAALLVVAIPATTSAQFIYQRSDRYERGDRRDVRQTINRLDNSAAQLERDLTAGRQRRVLGGLFWVNTADTNAVSEVRDFRLSLRELRQSLRNESSLNQTRDEARAVLQRGLRLDRYLRVRTGDANVDAHLASVRSELNLLAEVYDLSYRY